MATYTSNYGWTKPSGSDNVDISVLNNNLDDQDSTIHDAFLNMAPPFSESSTYAVDDIVLYDTGLYKCHTAVVTPGSWTGSTNWQVYKLSEGGSGGGGTSNYNDLTNKPSINGVALSGNKTTSDLGINADNVMMSDGVTSVEDAINNCVITEKHYINSRANFTIALVTTKQYNIELTSINNQNIYNYYKYTIKYVSSGWALCEIDKVEKDSTLVALSLAFSGNNLVVTNTGGWGVEVMCQIASI